jgi:hypothetical protein
LLHLIENKSKIHRRPAPGHRIQLLWGSPNEDSFSFGTAVAIRKRQRLIKALKSASMELMTSNQVQRCNWRNSAMNSAYEKSLKTCLRDKGYSINE